MTLIAKLTAAVVLAGAAATIAPAAADAQRHFHHGRGWHGPEGHFLVYARACPDLREDRRDRRYDGGWRDRREDRRDRRIIDCPPRAWEYVPSRRELHQGRTGERLRPDYAYWDRRAGGYFVDTRWGPVPTYVVRGRGGRHGYRPHRHRYGHGYGYGRY